MGIYTQQFKEAVVKKALECLPAEHHGIAKEFNVGYSTLKKWIRRYEQDTGVLDMPKKEKRPQDWKRQERFNALIETAQLNEKDLGTYCRQVGLTTTHLEAWREEFISGKAEDPKAQHAKKKLKQTEAKLKALEKDLNRKNKALAETTALLVLKKKADILFREYEDD